MVGVQTQTLSGIETAPKRISTEVLIGEDGLGANGQLLQ